MFRGAAQVVCPWPRARRLKHRARFDRETVVDLLSRPVELVEVDPRTLVANQTWVLLQHARYYTTGRWERTDLTSADQHQEVNQFPVVMPNDGGQRVIVAGHHRATAALVEGRPLLVRTAARTARAAVSPLVFWDPQVVTPDERDQLDTLMSGTTVDVPDLESARQLLVAAGADEAQAAAAVDRARRRVGR